MTIAPTCHCNATNGATALKSVNPSSVARPVRGVAGTRVVVALMKRCKVYCYKAANKKSRWTPLADITDSDHSKFSKTTFENRIPDCEAP
ncbi:hypothetical protein TCAL_15257 [Tigriopus californicus]|uniref:Uncharacterized protein n=1 Tax=Tigriopus californicus TaxID=6832 RepID=A0A553NC66_TIGCA|nr:hypothetical protein TCAL_15257 [Tigriopus californicus]